MAHAQYAQHVQILNHIFMLVYIYIVLPLLFLSLTLFLCIIIETIDENFLHAYVTHCTAEKSSAACMNFPYIIYYTIIYFFSG